MKIIFGKKLYNHKAVNNAIKEYGHLADFAISEKKDDITVNLKNIDEDVKNIIQDEFCNYVLFLMKR